VNSPLGFEFESMRSMATTDVQSTGVKSLRKTMSTVLCCLVDDRIVAAPEGVALLRALNLLMMKTLENSNRYGICPKCFFIWHSHCL